MFLEIIRLDAISYAVCFIMSQKTKKIYDVIRGEWVVVSPEELLRQKLIHYMISELSYPQDLIVVERSLKEMPHLQTEERKFPNRRVDLLCFAKEIHSLYSLYPLIVLECKTTKISSKALEQVEGYNHFLRSYFVAVANGEEMRTGWLDKNSGRYRYIHRLPSFFELLEFIKE